jgi:hypothetical protein
MKISKLLFLSFLLAVAACDENSTHEKNEQGLREYFIKHPVASGQAYMVMKKNALAKSWLATIHGYPDNQRVCNDLIKPYNDDPKQSVIEGQYFCEAVRTSN